MARILLIDDSPIAVEAMRQVLLAEGHVVLELGSLLDLRRAIQDDPPDVVVLDLNMPLMGGRQVGAYIRRFQTRQIPIVIHSSEPFASILKARREIGAEAILMKGSSDLELIRLVSKLGSPEACQGQDPGA